MSRKLPYGLWFLCLLWVTVLRAAASVQPSDDSGKLPLGEWIREPEHNPFHWKVVVNSGLSYQLRPVITLHATYSIRKKSQPRDIYVFVRVANEVGHWFPEMDSSHLRAESVAGKDANVHMWSSFFARPGNYRITLVAYDAISREHGVWHKEATAEAKGFLPEYPKASRIEFIDPESTSASGGAWLPVTNERPTRVDLILNVADRENLALNNYADPVRRDMAPRILLQIGTVLSRLALRNGCVRVSAVDIGHLNVLADRLTASEVDWKKVLQYEKKNSEQGEVNVHSLEARTRAFVFFRDYVQHVISDESGCTGAGHDVDRAVVVVSDSIQFPARSERPANLSVPTTGAYRFYYLRLTMWEMLPPILRSMQITTYQPADELGSLLRPIGTRTFPVAKPKDFQDALAKLVSALGQPGEASGE